MDGYKVQKFGESCESCKYIKKYGCMTAYGLYYCGFDKNKLVKDVSIEKNGICNNYKRR